MEKLTAFIVLCFVGYMFALGLGLLAAFPVKWLWNYAATFAFNAPRIDYWHALGLMWLCSFLVKSGPTASAKS